MCKQAYLPWAHKWQCFCHVERTLFPLALPDFWLLQDPLYWGRTVPLGRASRCAAQGLHSPLSSLVSHDSQLQVQQLKHANLPSYHSAHSGRTHFLRHWSPAKGFAALIFTELPTTTAFRQASQQEWPGLYISACQLYLQKTSRLLIGRTFYKTFLWSRLYSVTSFQTKAIQALQPVSGQEVTKGRKLEPEPPSKSLVQSGSSLAEKQILWFWL